MWCSKPPHGQIDMKFSVNKFRSKSFHWSYDNLWLIQFVLPSFYSLFFWYSTLWWSLHREGMTMLEVRKLWPENRIFWDIKGQIVELAKKSRSHHSDWTVKNQFLKKSWLEKFFVRTKFFNNIFWTNEIVPVKDWNTTLLQRSSFWLVFSFSYCDC